MLFCVRVGKKQLEGSRAAHVQTDKQDERAWLEIEFSIDWCQAVSYKLSFS